MINFLSNPHWINPQLDFLVFLQNIRIGNFDIFDKFFLSITIFGEFWLPTLVCAIAYWCIDFRAGLYLFFLEGFNSLIAHFFKMVACVYRPWILSDKIHPSELAVPYAKGYSFPSGHSAMSASVLGGVAFLSRKKILPCILLICLILLIGFSRLWLGVHTPQDVICGLLIGFCLIFVTNKVIDWAEQNPNRYLILALFVNITAIFILIYICYFNTYREDYIDGKLLVNPRQTIFVTSIVYGYILGLLNGCFICRKFFPFNPKSFSLKKRTVIGVIGSIFIIFIFKNIIQYVFVSGYSMKLSFSVMFITGLFITLIYPIIFQYSTKTLKIHDIQSK